MTNSITATSVSICNLPLGWVYWVEVFLNKDKTNVTSTTPRYVTSKLKVCPNGETKNVSFSFSFTY